mmetsp:Transcript_149138/g.277973  ORF Transcript_149138/g.277973 Transcript_149138/m.277973 type:complete len:135 (-) Transcript_149138:1530-1934(-)
MWSGGISLGASNCLRQCLAKYLSVELGTVWNPLAQSVRNVDPKAIVMLNQHLEAIAALQQRHVERPPAAIFLAQISAAWNEQELLSAKPLLAHLAKVQVYVSSQANVLDILRSQETYAFQKCAPVHLYSDAKAP